MKPTIVYMLLTILFGQPLSARVQHGGNTNRVAVQNHSTNVNRNYNQNTNVNRNVNVNRDVNVNVHGGCCYNGGYYHEDNNWGAFAAGAAVGVATTAVVAAATRPATTTTVVAVPVGSMVPTLPGGCSTVASGGAVIYSCGGMYYRPYYQGTSLVYQVVTYP
jgi:hypothetical protein